MTSQSTSASLLQRLREPSDHDAWIRFVDLYTPLMHYWARRRLGVADANDLVQDVFTALVEELPKFAYDPGKSSRAWLWTIMRNRWLNAQRRRHPMPNADDAVLAQVMDAAEPFWEEDHRQHLVRRALELMQADFQFATWKACWEMIVNDRPAADVAGELGLSVGAVHAARFRVLARLRVELRDFLD